MTETSLSLSTKRESFLKEYIATNVLPQRFINYGRNTKLSKCIGIIGPRGSCKSIAAAAMSIMDYLVAGWIVISNMEVKWGVRLGDLIAGYQSEELDKMALMKFDIKDKVAVLIDEVNIEFSESRRSMTNRNLIFNKILQQLRKRQMNMVYTVQHEMWIDNRLRWQTDLFIKTKDVCMKPGGIYLPYDFGEYASWKMFDMSGIFGQGSYSDTLTPIIDDWWFSAKRWWNTFNTNEIQGLDQDDYAGASAGGIELKRNSDIVKQEGNTSVLFDLFQEAHDNEYKFIEAKDLFRTVGATTKAGKDLVGSMIREMGIRYNQHRRAYVVPEFDLEKPETMKDLKGKTFIQQGSTLAEADKVSI